MSRMTTACKQQTVAATVDECIRRRKGWQVGQWRVITRTAASCLTFYLRYFFYVMSLLQNVNEL